MHCLSYFICGSIPSKHRHPMFTSLSFSIFSTFLNYYAHHFLTSSPSRINWPLISFLHMLTFISRYFYFPQIHKTSLTPSPISQSFWNLNCLLHHSSQCSVPAIRFHIDSHVQPVLQCSSRLWNRCAIISSGPLVLYPPTSIMPHTVIHTPLQESPFHLSYVH